MSSQDLFAQKWTTMSCNKSCSALSLLTMNLNTFEVTLPAELSISFRDNDGVFHIYHGTAFKIVNGRIIATVDASSETSTWHSNSRSSGHPIAPLLAPPAPRPPYGPPQKEFLASSDESSVTLGSEDTEEEDDADSKQAPSEEEEEEEQEEEEEKTNMIASSSESESSSVLRLRDGPHSEKRGRPKNRDAHWISKKRKTRSDKGKMRGIACEICMNGREMVMQCRNERCAKAVCFECFQGIKQRGLSDPKICSFCRTRGF